jgi:hypothetical protein
MKKKEKDLGGRRWFDGKSEDIVVAQLCEVWGLGGSDSEAAYFADIGKSTLSRYLKAHPEVEQRKDRLKEKPILEARTTLSKAIKEGHADLALKYLERKKKDEFSERKEVVVDDSKRTEFAKAAIDNPELAKEISDLMRRITGK